MRSHRLVFGTVLLAAFLGCASQTASDAETAGAQTSGSVKRAWDLSYIFPEDRANSLTPSSIGLDPSIFTAAFTHATHKFTIFGQDADDIFTEIPEQAPSPFEDQDCIPKPENWRLTQVRLEPYALAVPGTVSAFTEWAKSRGKEIDRIVQLRITLHPFCGKSGEGSPISDHAMHLIFNLRPSDAALNDAVFGSAMRYIGLQLGEAPNLEASHAELAKHLDALASPEYAAFRKSVLADFLDVASVAEKGTTDADYEVLETTAQKFRQTRLGTVTRAIFHPNLKQRGSPLEKKLVALVKKYGTLANLDHVAAMMTTGDGFPNSTDWFFSALTPGRFAGVDQMPADARSVYDAFSPVRLDTFVAVKTGDAVDVTRATTAGFYMESRGAITGSKRDAHVLTGPLASEVAKVDYETEPQTDGTGIFLALPKNDALKSAMDRFSDPATTNATTTPCDRCHNMQNAIENDSGFSIPPDTDIGYQFHMIRAGTELNLRTVHELDAELPRLKAELGGT